MNSGYAALATTKALSLLQNKYLVDEIFIHSTGIFNLLETVSIDVMIINESR